MTHRAGFAAASILSLLPALAGAQSAPMVEAPPNLWVRSEEAPPLELARGFAVPPLAELPPAPEAARDEIEALRAWNAAGRLPLRNGFTRPLPLPHQVELDARLARAASGDLAGGVFARRGASAVWATQVRVEEAHRLRLYLAEVDLPTGTRLWVYGEEGVARGPFGLELLDPEGGIWTPSVPGPAIKLELEIPDAALEAGARPRFHIERLLEIVRLEEGSVPSWGLAPRADVSCLGDVNCYGAADWPVIEQAKRAIAQLFFIDGGSGFVCTGGLLNDMVNSFTPYLLTANHCFATQSAAASLEALWDGHTTGCNAGLPPSFPVTNGSTLLATSSASDFTLVRAHSVPPNRVHLGWTTESPGNQVLHRISHPVNPNTSSILTQRYTRSPGLRADFFQCAGGQWDINNPAKFHHHSPDLGGTFPGSSGAPLILGNGQVVGQLFGACGSNIQEGCDNVNNDTIDGAFGWTYASIASFLSPGAGDPEPPYATWISSPALPGFRIQVRISGGAGAVEGKGEAQCIVESICVSGALAGRPEVFVKVIGPRPNGYLWVQISRFTPSKVEAWVQRTSTGQINYYQLAAVGAADDDVSGLQHREAFLP